MSELPKGWIEKEIGMVNEYKAQTLNPIKFPDEVFELFSVPIFPTGRAEVILGKDIGSTKQVVKEGDVLLCKINPRINRVWVVTESKGYRQIASSEWIVFRSDSQNSHFIRYFFTSEKFRTLLCSDISGVGGSLTRAKPKLVAKYCLELAPLAEQKRIVEKLDQVLAQVDTIKARLDGIPAILKRFRQSVLAAAVSGKLTEEWRGNSIFIKHELSEQWKWKDIPESWSVSYYSELVESRLGKMLDKAKNTGLATKYLGNINVRWLHVDLTNTQEILVSEQERQDLSLQKGDVLICEGGEPGRCAIWASSDEQSIIFQKALHRARVKSKIIPEWLVYNLKNDADSLFLNQLFTGTTIKHLTGKALKNYPLRVPSIQEQTEIVRLVDQYFAFADTIEKQVQKAQQRVDKLTQSILAKAFRGELVPQDPTDEPADELLKRIAAARAEAEALALSAKKTAKKVGKKTGKS